MYDTNDGISTIRSASILDKTDWRKSIHKFLENCVRTMDTTAFPNAVKSLAAAVSAEFPNFNAKREINDYVEELNKEYTEVIREWIDKKPGDFFHPGKREMVAPTIENEYYKDTFEFIKNMLARKRMLLWGIRSTPGGTEMED